MTISNPLGPAFSAARYGPLNCSDPNANGPLAYIGQPEVSTDEFGVILVPNDMCSIDWEQSGYNNPATKLTLTPDALVTIRSLYVDCEGAEEIGTLLNVPYVSGAAVNVTIDESYGAWDLPSPLVIDGTQGASATIEVLDATAGFGQPWNINNWPFVYVVQLCETSAAVCAQLLGREPGGQPDGGAGLGPGGGGGGTPHGSLAFGLGGGIDSSLSAAEISQQLTPGSSGRGPFDLSKYPGFCRKMRPPNVPVLTVQRMWLSGRQRNYTDVSLVTQLSADRLYMLEGQCGAWGSIIAAAVHVPLMQGKIVSELPELEGKDVGAPLEIISEFHERMERRARATDHSRWFETSISYRIPYEEGFEPYVLVQRRFVPWYDERFKGYRKNKVVHLMHMFRLGVEFASTPHGYVVHSPHPVANSWNTTQATGFWYK
ncbi:expressed protein, partial [Chlorella variabilis]